MCIKIPEYTCIDLDHTPDLCIIMLICIYLFLYLCSKHLGVEPQVTGW